MTRDPVARRKLRDEVNARRTSGAEWDHLAGAIINIDPDITRPPTIAEARRLCRPYGPNSSVTINQDGTEYWAYSISAKDLEGLRRSPSHPIS